MMALSGYYKNTPPSGVAQGAKRAGNLSTRTARSQHQEDTRRYAPLGSETGERPKELVVTP